MNTNSHRDDKTPLGEALEFAERWKGVHTDESYGPQGKIMGTLSRELLALHAQLSETRRTYEDGLEEAKNAVKRVTSAGRWDCGYEEPFDDAVQLCMSAIRAIKKSDPQGSDTNLETTASRVAPAASAPCVARPSEDAVLMAQTAIERFGSRRFDKLTLDQADQLRMAREILRLHALIDAETSSSTNAPVAYRWRLQGFKEWTHTGKLEPQMDRFGFEWEPLYAAPVSATLPKEETTDSEGDWQCRDYGDGWITFPDRKAAEKYQQDTGAMMRYRRFYPASAPTDGTTLFGRPKDIPDAEQQLRNIAAAMRDDERPGE